MIAKVLIQSPEAGSFQFSQMPASPNGGRKEIAHMTKEEIDLSAGMWTLHGGRTKNAIPRAVPLSALAVRLLRDLPEWKGAYLFSTTSGERPISGFTKLKSRLDRRMSGIAPWTLHDLRRTMRTHLSALRIPQHVAELMIGHKQGGIVAVYDVHRYQAEMRAGFEQWAARLLRIVEPGSGKVVKLRR